MSEPLPSGQFPDVITIDGPAASGKSSVGAALAFRYNMQLFDTGMTYRAFTHFAIQRGIAWDDVDACGELARSLDMRLEGRVETELWVDGQDVTDQLRSPDVEARVSEYSAIPAVREAMVALQRAIAARARCVVVGRDIGTVVLPDAKVKLFLTADEGERARRRSQQAGDWGQAQDTTAANRDIAHRDKVDSTRATSPLRPALDAVIIDTTSLTLDEVIARAIEVVECASA